VNPNSTLKELNTFGGPASVHPSTALHPEWDPDSHKYVEQLQQHMTAKMVNEGIERANRRFDTFLQDHIDINWEDQRKKIYEHFGLASKSADTGVSGSHFNASERGGFGRTRRSRGTQDTPNKGISTRSVFGQSGMQKSVIGAPAVGQGNLQIFGESPDKSQQHQQPIQEDRFLREKEAKFAEKIQRLNESRLEDKFYPVLREFMEVEASPGGESPPQILDAYKALIEITSEDTETNRLQPRKFKGEYLDDNINSEGSRRCRNRILNGSRHALEKQFFEQLGNVVTRNPREASLGGIPSRINRVRAYIRVRAARKDLVPDGAILQQIGDDYCWALIFYLLRCGFIQEAATYVTENANAFKSIDRLFATYITMFASSPDRRLPPQNQNKMNNEYMQRIRLAPDNQTDPYRLACYKVIGRCELSKRSIDNISQGVEDWMWLQFCLARESNRTEDAATDVYGLREVQETIREIGQRHFQKGTEGVVGGYGTFLYLQILGGLFENAVSYLYSHSYVSAIHFAIALDFYGLLRVSDFNASESELLTYTTREQPQINFGRMVGYYTRDFRAGNSIAATDYLCLIYLNSDLGGELGKSYMGLCHEALRELVLETREFATLLGDIYANGTRIKGAIEQRLPLIGFTDQEEYLRTVTIQAARVADENGRTTDAVLLYHLAEDYNNVISILNRALSDAISSDEGLGQTTKIEPLKPRETTDQNGSSLSLVAVDDPIKLAQHFIDLYNPNALLYEHVSPQNREVCGLLMRIAEAKSHMEQGKWASALDVSTK
jgi:nuclear pore complex protein Nup93